jgi:fatty-acyl-CoA synthase
MRLPDQMRPSGGSDASRHDWLRALARTARIDSEPSRILPILVDERAAELGDATAIISERDRLSWKQFASLANRYAGWARSQGIRSGDRVCLFMPNRADYVAIWLGISRIGGVVALINTNLRGDSLAHCLNASQPKHVIVDHSLTGAFRSAMPNASGPRSWVHGESSSDLEPILSEIAQHSSEPPPGPQPISIADPALLIYTSGTTGLPKAAVVSHRRIMVWSHWFAGMLDIGRTDRFYDCLPLYHSIGGVAAVGATLVGGGSVVVRERFSTSRFWDDIVAQDCTVFQYIGELCRYLVNAAPSESEHHHRLRLACGNGLSAEVWEKFETRFRIPRIIEFYAATEGNFSLYNCDGRRGSIGRIPRFLSHLANVALVRLDPSTNKPQRGADGLCLRCQAGEIGEALGEVRSHGQTGRFEGYTDEVATAEKIVHDVFKHGDKWIRSGDLLRQDEEGFFYFVDRIGDTFRWKGENVATTEVQGVIAGCDGVLEVNVYGVAVPGTEGRAGMAAVVVSSSFSIDTLEHHLKDCLPSYARPVFLRICQELAITATFKPPKLELARQGFDPRATTDPLYFSDFDTGAYVPLDDVLYQRIAAGDARV